MLNNSWTAKDLSSHKQSRNSQMQISIKYMSMPKEASINLIGLMFETYTHACQSTNHTSI